MSDTDREEVHALRELAASAAGLKADLESTRDELRLERVKCRDLETALQGANREVQKLRLQRETAWSQACSRRPDDGADPETEGAPGGAGPT